MGRCAFMGTWGGLALVPTYPGSCWATVQYDISERWRLAAGWRHFYAKQSKDDFDVNIKLDGPILGVTYRF